MPPKLKAVEFGYNKYCGPAVLSILTGRSTDECAKVISQVSKQYTVVGVTLTDLMESARRLGFNTENMHIDGMSLFRALLTLAPKGDGTFIVNVPNHWVCIEVTDGKLYFCDNHTKEPIPAASSARLSMPALAVWKLTRNPDFKEPVKVVPKPQPKYRMITLWECEECLARAMSIDTIFHEPDCKWRGHENDS